MKINIGILSGSIVIIICLGLLMAGCGATGGGTSISRAYNAVSEDGEDMTVTINETDKTWGVTYPGTTDVISGTYEVASDGAYDCYFTVGGSGSFELVEVKDNCIFALVDSGSGNVAIAGAARGNYAESQLAGTYNFIDFEDNNWGSMEINATTHTYNYTTYSLVAPELRTIVSTESGKGYTYDGMGIAHDDVFTDIRYLVCPNGTMIVDNGSSGMSVAMKKPASSDLAQYDAEYVSMVITDETEGLITLEASGTPSVKWNFPPNSGTGTMEVITNGAYHYKDNLAPSVDAVFIMSPNKILLGLQDIGSIVNIVGADPH